MSYGKTLIKIYCSDYQAVEVAEYSIGHDWFLGVAGLVKKIEIPNDYMISDCDT